MAAKIIKLVFLISFILMTSVVLASDYTASDFAATLLPYPYTHGLFGPVPYNDPNAVLGKPTTLIRVTSATIFTASLVYPAYKTAPDGTNLVVTLDLGDQVTAAFDHNVSDDDANPYGIDFIVFGNSILKGNGERMVAKDTNMDDYFLSNPAAAGGEFVSVSVAQYPDGPWYTFISGPYADYIYPTNPFAWNSDSNNWGNELNFLKPVNPDLSISDFDGLSAAQAIALYDGSAGGTGFDLKWLSSQYYNALENDPLTGGKKWIKYIKVTSVEAGEVDAFADVASCGDYRHPYPDGDINHDCKVDYLDIRILCDYWLANIIDPNSPAAAADLNNDNIINSSDLARIADSWMQCTWNPN